MITSNVNHIIRYDKLKLLITAAPHPLKYINVKIKPEIVRILKELYCIYMC